MDRFPFRFPSRSQRRPKKGRLSYAVHQMGPSLQLRGPSGDPILSAANQASMLFYGISDQEAGAFSDDIVGGALVGGPFAYGETEVPHRAVARVAFWEFKDST